MNLSGVFEKGILTVTSSVCNSTRLDFREGSLGDLYEVYFLLVSWRLGERTSQRSLRSVFSNRPTISGGLLGNLFEVYFLLVSSQLWEGISQVYLRDRSLNRPTMVSGGLEPLGDPCEVYSQVVS